MACQERLRKLRRQAPEGVRARPAGGNFKHFWDRISESQNGPERPATLHPPASHMPPLGELTRPDPDLDKRLTYLSQSMIVWNGLSRQARHAYHRREEYSPDGLAPMSS